MIERDVTPSTGTADMKLEVVVIPVSDVDRAKGIIQQNASGLETIALALLDRESLDGAEVRTILKGGTLPPMPPSGKADSSEGTQRVLRPEGTS